MITVYYLNVSQILYANQEIMYQNRQNWALVEKIFHSQQIIYKYTIC